MWTGGMNPGFTFGHAGWVSLVLWPFVQLAKRRGASPSPRPTQHGEAPRLILTDRLMTSALRKEQW